MSVPSRDFARADRRQPSGACPEYTQPRPTPPSQHLRIAHASRSGPPHRLQRLRHPIPYPIRCARAPMRPTERGQVIARRQPATALLQYLFRMPCCSDLPRCSSASSPVKTFGNSAFPVPVLAFENTLNAASGDVAWPVPETLRCRRGMAKYQVPHRPNFAQTPPRLCPAGNRREPVSSVSVNYAAQANGHAPVKTSHHTQRAVVTGRNRHEIRPGTLEPP